MNADDRLNLPHHDPSVRFVSDPTPSLGETVVVAVDVPARSGVYDVQLRGVRDGEPYWVDGRVEGDRWHFELECTQTVVNYRFHCETDAGDRWLTGHGLLDWDPPDLWDFRLLTTGGTPSWVPETVWYQIFPDRFATSGRHQGAWEDAPWAEPCGWDAPVATGRAAMHQLYGGDLDGVVEHLDHLEDLGVGGIYATPVFPARSNHRYDATTFDRVDPILGGDEALVRLSDAARRRGMRVMTDLTLNHTGNGHEWFLAAQRDPSSPEADYYFFTDHPDGYESWLGVPTLPKLDHRSAAMRAAYYEGPASAAARFLQPPFDMSGWRIDVANMTGRLGSIDQNHEVARRMRATMRDVAPDAWLVGEHFHDAIPDTPGDGWHGVMNYGGICRPVVSWLGHFSSLAAMMPGPGQSARDAVQMATAMDAVRAAMPWQVTLGSMALLSSHDTARWRSMAVSDDVALVGFGLVMTLPGSPTFFYGDEVGLTGDDNEQARRPMPWESAAWDRRFLDHFRSLIRLRNAEAALHHGGFRWVDVQPEAVVFLRETADERLLVRAARSAATPVDVSTASLRSTEAIALFGADDLRPTHATLTIPGDGPALSIWRLS